MKLPWPLGALEIGIGLAALLLGLVALMLSLGGAAGGYTGALQAVMRLQLIVVAIQILTLVGLIGTASIQHRALRRASRTAALAASRRASDAFQHQVLTAAANLESAARAMQDLLAIQRQATDALTAAAEQSGVDVVRPVPPPGVSGE